MKGVSLKLLLCCLSLFSLPVFAWQYPSTCKECKTVKRMVAEYPIVRVECSCKNEKGEYVKSSLIMRRRGFKCFVVSNFNGKLVCAPSSPRYTIKPTCRDMTTAVSVVLNKRIAADHCAPACKKLGDKWTGKWYPHSTGEVSMCVCKHCG